MAASTSIQSKWRSHADIKTYTSIRCKVIALQCFVRQLIARDVKKQLLKERRIMEAEMTTKMAAAWRRYHCQTMYKNDIRCIIICQSVVRRRTAIEELHVLKSERDSAVALQCFVRQLIARDVMEQLLKERRIMEAEMTTKMAAAWRRYHCQTMYKNDIRCIIICQSVVRRRTAIEELHVLKSERDTAAATIIEAEVRSFLARRRLMRIKCSAILLQSLVRGMIAFEEVEMLREQRFMLRSESATKIAAIWRSYYLRTGYIVVLRGMNYLFVSWC